MSPPPSSSMALTAAPMHVRFQNSRLVASLDVGPRDPPNCPSAVDLNPLCRSLWWTWPPLEIGSSGPDAPSPVPSHHRPRRRTAPHAGFSTDPHREGHPISTKQLLRPLFSFSFLLFIFLSCATIPPSALLPLTHLQPPICPQWLPPSASSPPSRPSGPSSSGALALVSWPSHTASSSRDP